MDDSAARRPAWRARRRPSGLPRSPGLRPAQNRRQRRRDHQRPRLSGRRASSPRATARRCNTSSRMVTSAANLYNEALSKSFVAFMRANAPNAFIYCMGVSQTLSRRAEAGFLDPVLRRIGDYDRSGSIVFTRRACFPDPQAVDKVVRACSKDACARSRGTTSRSRSNRSVSIRTRRVAWRWRGPCARR